MSTEGKAAKSPLTPFISSSEPMAQVPQRRWYDHLCVHCELPIDEPQFSIGLRSGAAFISTAISRFTAHGRPLHLNRLPDRQALILELPLAIEVLSRAKVLIANDPKRFDIFRRADPLPSSCIFRALMFE